MPSGVSAQNPSAQTPIELPGIVVTGPTGSAISPDVQTAKQLLDIYPGATSLVTSKDFNLGRGGYLEDYIRFTPGLFIQSAQASEDVRVSIRGSGIDADAVAGLALLIDGMPINQGDGEAYLWDVDLNSVKYAEVFRGSDALHYGSITLGGAINLVTFTGGDVPPLTMRLSVGSYGFTEQRITSGWSNGPVDIYASILNHVLEGFQDWSQENYQKVFTSIGYRIGNAENRFYFFFGRLVQNNPTALTKEELYADPRQTEPEAVQEKWNTSWDYYRFIDRFAVKGDQWELQVGAYWNYRQQTQLQEYDPDTPLGTQRYYSNDFGAGITFTSTADLLGARNRFVIGFLPTLETEHDAWYANTNGTIGPLLSGDRTLASNLPIYMENQHWITERLSLLTGFQAVFVQREYHDSFPGLTGGNDSANENFYAFNPKLGFAYDWNEKSKVYINFSRSFQPPSFDESLGLSDSGGEIFNYLEPQTGWTLEMGIRGEYGPVSWDLAIYRSWIRDELLSLNNNMGVPVGTVNVPHTIHQGVEAEAEITIAHSLLSHGDNLVLQQSYTLNAFHFRNNSTYGNNQIAGIPSQFYKAELRYEHPSGFYAGANVQWNITKYPVDMANTLYANPYAIMGVRTGYKSAKGWAIFLEAANLMNKTYAAMVQPIADARTGGPPNVFNPGSGRAFYGGVSWAW